MEGKSGCLFAAIGGVIVLILLIMLGYPQYRVYSQRLAGQAALAEAQSSRQVAILEARAKKESAVSLAEAEVIRAEGAAKANHILQNSLGGPEGYLRYLQIQALEGTKASLIYVPTEAGLPVTEAGRLEAPAPRCCRIRPPPNPLTRSLSKGDGATVVYGASTGSARAGLIWFKLLARYSNAKTPLAVTARSAPLGAVLRRDDRERSVPRFDPEIVVAAFAQADLVALDARDLAQRHVVMLAVGRILA